MRTMKIDDFIFSHSRDIDSAYIITLPNNRISCELTKRCVNSCEKVNQKYTLWQGVDGTNNGKICFPEHLANKDYFNWIKIHDNRLTSSQIACVLSHFSLWAHCLTIDKPIIILEHDAIMVNSLHKFEFYNMIQYLGCIEQYLGQPQYIIPPHGSLFDYRYRFICRAHAYAIDPQIAKRLVTKFIEIGLTETSTADTFIRADWFPIIQKGLYAYDLSSAELSTVEELDESWKPAEWKNWKNKWKEKNDKQKDFHN